MDPLRNNALTQQLWVMTYKRKLGCVSVSGLSGFATPRCVISRVGSDPHSLSEALRKKVVMPALNLAPQGPVNYLN